MQYQNKQPAEGLNVTRHNPFLHFVKLMVVATVLVVLLVLLLNRAGALLAKYIPFHYEVTLMHKAGIEFGENKPDALVSYLNRLSAEISEHMQFPDGTEFTVHYNANEVFNAFATLGGNIVFYRELLRQMPNENALAMVMAHEMSHVIHRDALAGSSGGVASMLALTMLTGTSVLSSNIFTQTGSLAQLNFSREMEMEADRTALKAIVSLYGHVAGADTLFRLLNQDQMPGERGDTDAAQLDSSRVTNWISEFASSHPLDKNRIDAIAEMARQSGWATSGELKPLPTEFKQWLQDKR